MIATQHLQAILGNEYPAFVASLLQAPPVSLRLNAAKPNSEPIFANTLPVAWYEQGIYLAQRPSFTLDPLLHAGAYYVQEASSMFIAQALRQTTDLSKSLNVLDMCAAPGGKTTLLASLLNAESNILANETVRTRAHILSENLAKWGSSNTAVTCNDPAHFERLSGRFEVVLCDAPCSGEGMFRKNPDAMQEWSLGAIQLCANRQQRILANVADLVTQNGVLIYSTCTFNEQENEAQIAYLLQHPDFDYTCEPLQLNPDWQIVETNRALPNGKTIYAYRFYPHRVQGEGLFVACLRRHDTPKSPMRNAKNLPDKVQLLPKKEAANLNQWLQNPDNFSFITYNDDIFALPKTLWQQWQQWANTNLYWLNMGIRMGKMAKNSLIPAHELALSTTISHHIPTIHLDNEQALNYLRRNDINLNDEQAALQGWQTVSYQNHRLGWVKIVQGRLNNYYPKEWRIKMS